MPDEMSPAERDLRTAALNSNATIKLLTSILSRLDTTNPRPAPSGFAGGGEFLAAVRRQRVEHLADPRLLTNAATTWAGSSENAGGGFALPDEFRDEVLMPVTGSGSLLGAFDPMPTPSNVLSVAVDETADWDEAGVTANIVREGVAIQPSKGVLKPVRVLLHAVPALVHASEELINRSKGYQGYVWRALGRKLRNRVERLLLWGTGLDEPLGLMNGPNVVVAGKEGSQGAATIVEDNVGKMAARLIPSSFPSSIWIASTTALPQIMKVGTIYNANGASPFGYGTLLGRPLAVSAHAKPLGELGDLALVDPQAYLYAVDGPHNAATIEFAFEQGLDSFRGTLYFGGAPLLSAPVAPAEGTDTLSTCVALEARS